MTIDACAAAHSRGLKQLSATTSLIQLFTVQLPLLWPLVAESMQLELVGRSLPLNLCDKKDNIARYISRYQGELCETC